MNLANCLTLSRFVLSGLFVIAMLIGDRLGLTSATIIFIIAGVTDTLDGIIARRRAQITNFGTLMDPLADKVLICSAFICFVEHHWVPAWVVITIVTREFAITGLRLLAATRQQVLAAAKYGKHKTVSQTAAVIVILLRETLAAWQLNTWLNAFVLANRPWLEWLSLAVVCWALVMTVVSGLIYFWRNRLLYLSE